MLSEKNAAGNRSRDIMGNLQVGFTPFFKINEKLAITTDLTMVGNVRQGKTFDMKGNTGISGLNGYFITASAGISYNFGKGTKNILWKTDASDLTERLEALEAENIGYENAC